MNTVRRHTAEWSVDPNGVYNYDPNDPNTVEYAMLAAREFRGDGIGRYLVRDVNPNTLSPMGPTVWTDRVGSAAYGDFVTDYDPNLVVADTTRYLGFAQQDYNGASWDSMFQHHDMLGSTTLTAEDTGQREYEFIYTAFGELWNWPDDRDTKRR